MGKAGDPGVMGSLPSTRPARIGGRRDEAGTDSKPAKAAKPAGAGTVAAKPKPVTRPGPPKRSARSTGAPTPKGASKVPSTQPKHPPPVSAGAPEPDAAAPPSSAGASHPPSGLPQSGTQLVTTVVHAASDVAGLGLKVSGQVLKRAVSRLPRP